MTSTSALNIEIATGETLALDLNRLLGFRDLAGVGTDEAELAAALDAAHVKIGEGGIPVAAFAAPAN